MQLGVLLFGKYHATKLYWAVAKRGYTSWISCQKEVHFQDRSQDTPPGALWLAENTIEHYFAIFVQGACMGKCFRSHRRMCGDVTTWLVVVCRESIVTFVLECTPFWHYCSRVYLLFGNCSIILLLGSQRPIWRVISEKCAAQAHSTLVRATMQIYGLARVVKFWWCIENRWFRLNGTFVYWIEVSTKYRHLTFCRQGGTAEEQQASTSTVHEQRDTLKRITTSKRWKNNLAQATATRTRCRSMLATIFFGLRVRPSHTRCHSE